MLTHKLARALTNECSCAVCRGLRDRVAALPHHIIAPLQADTLARTVPNRLLGAEINAEGDAV